MNQELKNKCDLLVRNRDIIQDIFSFKSESMRLAAASIYAGLGMEADPQALAVSKQVLKEKTAPLSPYRGDVRMPLLSKMSLSDDPAQYFDDIQAITGKIKEFKKMGTEFQIMAALTIRDHADMTQAADAVGKTGAIYQGMKANHPWLTSREDIPFAAMLAVSDLDTEALLTEMEACYNILTDHFHSKDAVQSLSQVLATDPADAASKCSKVIAIFDKLKDAGHKFGTSYELAVLGTLAMLDLPVETIVDEIIQADDYLDTKKGFGTFRLGDKTRRMYAALMVMDTHMPPATSAHESALDSTLALVIAMEVCMMIIIMTTVTVTNSVN